MIKKRKYWVDNRDDPGFYKAVRRRLQKLRNPHPEYSFAIRLLIMCLTPFIIAVLWLIADEDGIV